MVSLVRWRLAAVVPILVASSLTATAFASAAPAPTLASELLVAKDLPGGWSAYPSAGFDSGLPACLGAVYRRAPGQLATAQHTFSAPDGRASFQDRLVGFDSAAAAESGVARLERSVASCTTSPRGPLLAVEPIRATVRGDRSRAFVVTLGRPATSRVYAVLVTARRGDTVVVATHGGVSANTPEALRLARAAVDRVR